mgnify:CR=1 FL=1
MMIRLDTDDRALVEVLLAQVKKVSDPTPAQLEQYKKKYIRKI